jgi:hypothetical protein
MGLEKSRGKSKTRSQRDHTYPGVWGNYDLRPQRGRTRWISWFYAVASRWDAVGMEIRSWMMIKNRGGVKNRSQRDHSFPGGLGER